MPGEAAKGGTVMDNLLSLRGGSFSYVITTQQCCAGFVTHERMCGVYVLKGRWGRHDSGTRFWWVVYKERSRRLLLRFVPLLFTKWIHLLLTPW